MGNICRSPAGECVFKHIISREGLDELIQVDSAGTIGFHTGEAPDPRMREEGQMRDISITGAARQIASSDLSKFDLILAMDKSNLQHLRQLDKNNRNSKKLKLFCDYVTKSYHREVPDPYYGGEEGFKLVMDLLEDGCEKLLDELRTQLKIEKKVS